MHHSRVYYNFKTKIRPKKNLYKGENFKPEIKPITENLQRELDKQAKGAKL